MEILILGGTRFLGRHLAELSLARGHRLTLFHRGQTHPELFPQACRILGDRRADLSRLDQTWDAVIDTCGYLPRHVQASARALLERCAVYCFISSISVYQDLTPAGIDESHATASWADAWQQEELAMEHYGALKAHCEQAVAQLWGGRSLLVRPGLIVGPHDNSDRFSYWPRRAARGGSILVPAPPESLLQWVDVRDLARFILDRVEIGQGGTYNVTGRPCAAADFLTACCGLAQDAQPVWVSREFLAAHEVLLWKDLPVFVPDEASGLGSVSIARALAGGLELRPVQATLRDTLAWDRTRNFPELKAGLRREREAELLELWGKR